MIVKQFERLFQVLSFKAEFAGHDIKVVVDNARTHSAKDYSLNEFGKNVGTRCLVDKIEFIDERGQTMSISCFFTDGENNGKSTGLLVLTRELKLAVHDKVKVDGLRKIMAKHVTFQNAGRLEKLPSKYQVHIIFT